jgi:hypothetical protein
MSGWIDGWMGWDVMGCDGCSRSERISFVCLVYFVRLSNVFSLFSFVPGPVVVKRYCDGSSKQELRARLS